MLLMSKVFPISLLKTDLSSRVHVLPRRDWISVLNEFAMHRFPSQYKRTATKPLVRPGKRGCWCSPKKENEVAVTYEVTASDAFHFLISPVPSFK